MPCKIYLSKYLEKANNIDPNHLRTKHNLALMLLKIKTPIFLDRSVRWGCGGKKNLGRRHEMLEDTDLELDSNYESNK